MRIGHVVVVNSVSRKELIKELQVSLLQQSGQIQILFDFLIILKSRLMFLYQTAFIGTVISG